MNVLGGLRAVPAKLPLHDGRPTCSWCGKGKLVLIDEHPHPVLGIAGITCRTLKCDDAPECGKLTYL